ncbi:hypothetical protein P43SY_004084 [Pythium insidiosum]|uniref:Tc1-like transposase DDE domain-containing protein n=1 Tax=Pythium insidiosum TaxID=114742 RepID=A0AAD5Q3L6_PYTIN|nr:hypothetical protein P43SY_004084 [Pythium insidiosum]
MTQLMEMVKAVGAETKFVVCEIARYYGHEAHFTPPYHPELQPIELVWAGVKNPIALDPAKSMAELEQKIHNGIQRIDSKFWVAAYLSVQRVETEYLDAVDDE